MNARASAAYRRNSRPIPIAARSRSTASTARIVGTIAKGLTLTGGVRHDDQTTYGGKILFSAGGVWVLGNTRLRANYDEGFKAPTLYQLYSEYGNRDLRPEQAHGWDAGIAQRLADGHLTLSATWFERSTRNLVEFADTPPRDDRPFGYYQNVDRAHAQGIEAAATATLGRLTIDANYTWTDAEDRSPGTTYGNDLIRRPRNTAYAAATFAWPFGLSTTAALTHAGHSFDDAGNLTRLGGYTLIDLRAEMPVGHGLSLFGRIENLTDKDYETAYRYGTLGRSVYGGVRAKF
jgi:vitamin B12 transporter